MILTSFAIRDEMEELLIEYLHGYGESLSNIKINRLNDYDELDQKYICEVWDKIEIDAGIDLEWEVSMLQRHIDHLIQETANRVMKKYKEKI